VYVSVETGFEPNAYPIMPHALTSESLLMASLLVAHSPAVGKSITNLCVGLPSWFFGLVGIRDPLHGGAHEAVQACRKAGAIVRMVTGDNILTAKAIAKECGILSSTTTAMASDIAMEGPEFRALSTEERDRIIPNLEVLTRSSPDDKRILVTRLKEMGEIVAVTGDGTNDAPALAAADIGLSMGISGTEVAREASSIVLMDDNFSSIVKAIMWGRAVNDAVKKFLQV